MKDINILIVDDSATDRKIIGDIMKEAGFENIMVAGSAEETSNMLSMSSGSSSPIDLILLDIIMPDVDGIEICRRIKKREPFKDTPVIMVTARVDSESLQQAFENGASDYITKPINKVELTSRVRSVLRLKEETDKRKAREGELTGAFEQIKLQKEKLESEIKGRRKLEQALRFFEKAVENMQIGVTITNMDGEIIYVNPAEAGMHGYAQDEFIGQSVRRFAPKELWKPMTREQVKKMKSWRRDSLNVKKDGTVFPVRLLSDMVADAHGKPMGIVITCEDITEEKEIEKEIKRSREGLEQRIEERTREVLESENKYRGLSEQFNALLEAIPDSLTLLSPDLKILWANSGASSVYNWSGGAVTGRFCYDICQGGNQPADDCPGLRSFKTGNMESAEIQTQNGRILNIRAFPIKDESGIVKNVIELAVDITEKLFLRAETVRAAHLASLGELSAGVAHEINNPINGIINCATILANKCGGHKKEKEICGMIISEGKRVANIVQALLSFARERKAVKGPVHLDRVMADALTLTSAHMRKDGIKFTVDIPPTLPVVVGHYQQIQQVFLNIINNAQYALNQKYTASADGNKSLSISAATLSVNKKSLVRITFLDKGTGIAAHLLDKVMNPFFSTKPHDKGTGLGLSISHGIIADHGGRLSVESREGEWTKVTIDLPAGGKK